MENEKTVKANQGIIYHELGHLYGYRLAHKHSKTNLGNVKRVEIGFLVNCVLPEKTYYHVENIFENRKEILKNTSKVERTIAWFIEVIAGCTFQCCFENNQFRYCFGSQNGKIGQIDYGNLSVIRNLSSFHWTFDEIYQIQKDFEDIIIEHQIINDLNIIVSEFENHLINDTRNQIILKNQELNELVEKIDKLITPNIINEYQKLIKKYTKIFRRDKK